MGDIQVQEDQDPPEVGQWWVNEHGKRMHIAGKTADGTFILEFPSGGVYRDHENWMKCRQLEGCDSWDWLEFPDSPGDGYRFIDKKADEKNVADEFWSSSQQKWVRVHNPLSTWDKTTVYRREVKPPTPVESPDDWVRYDYKGTQITCQRKALDPVKPLPTHERYDKHSCEWIPVYAPATMPVRLWISERITYEPGDWPVRCGVEPPSGLGSWAEIFPSPDGFFVKKQS